MNTTYHNTVLILIQIDMNKQATYMCFAAEGGSRELCPDRGTEGPICVTQFAFLSSGLHFTHIYLPSVGAPVFRDNTE